MLKLHLGLPRRLAFEAARTSEAVMHAVCFADPATQATIHAKTGTATGVSWWAGRVAGPRGDFVFVNRVLPPGEPIGSSPAMAAGLRALVEAGAL